SRFLANSRPVQARHESGGALADRHVQRLVTSLAFVREMQIWQQSRDERAHGANLSRPCRRPVHGEPAGILSRGEVSEWLMVPLSKSGVRKHRGFESHPLRQSRT